tara:strand:+ start:2166 stop:5546 length:3381 start_codon:yes stop_codon:yes gene_type:complete
MKIKLTNRPPCPLGKVLLHFFMKSIIFLFCSISFALSPINGEAQDAEIIIDTDMSLTIKQAFRLINKQTDYKFIYRHDLIKAAPNINLKKGVIKAGDLLDKALSPISFTYNFTDGGTIVVKKMPTDTTQKGQIKVLEKKLQFQVSGTVTDTEGAPLPGASIVEQGTTNGTQADFDGNFSISLEGENAILMISYVGFANKEVPILGQTNISVILEESAAALKEVVLVGYGSQSKRKLSSSVATIDSKTLADLPAAQLSQKLQGKLSGVQISQATGTPGGGIDIRIRGAASITAGSNPLYVVDGNPIVGGISDLDPDAIESISVLKDASATALYGSRGGNGVIVIDTKRAMAGKTKINYSGYGGIQQVPQRGRPDMMNAREFATFRKEIAEFRGQTVDPVYQNPEEYGEGTDWYDAILQVAAIQNHSLSLSSGSDTFRTTATAGYFNQEGVVVGSGYDRFSLRINTEFQPLEDLTIVMNVAPTYSKDSNSGVDGVGGIMLETAQTSPLAPLRNPDGSYTLEATSPGMFPTPNYVNSQLDRVLENSDTRILANLFAEYEIIDGLSFKTAGHIDMGNSRNFSFNGTTTGRRGVGLYEKPFSSLNQNKYLSWVNENLLNYNLNAGDHTLDALVGFTAQKFRQDLSSINGSNYEDDKVQTLNAAITISANSDVQEWSLLSYLARVNYDYRAKYLFSASIRRDGSSRFGEQNRWGNFPSVSAGWVLSEEDFMPKNGIVSFLKLRGSYGVSGNFNIGNYSHIPTISGANYVFGSSVAAGRRVDNLADRTIGWETNKQLNVGIDFNLLNDRINFNYNYYKKNTNDLLFNVRVPRASGFSNLQTNIGELKFWGHEFSVNTFNIQKEDFIWNTDFNISFNQNEVISMGTRTSSLITGPGSGLIGGSHITTEGEPIGMLYGMVHEGVYENQAEFESSPIHTTSQVGTAKFSDTNGDGVISVDDATIIGNPHPDFIFGMTNTMKFGNFDFAVTVSGTYGNDILRGAEQTLTNLDGVFNVLSSVVDRWRSPENPGSGRYGSIAAGTTYIERDFWGTQFMYDGSHLSINNITLGYTIQGVETDSFFNNFRLYGSVQNAYIFTNYPGANPQVSQSTNSTGLGIDGGSYPVPRIITLGINIGF